MYSLTDNQGIHDFHISAYSGEKNYDKDVAPPANEDKLEAFVGCEYLINNLDIYTDYENQSDIKDAQIADEEKNEKGIKGLLSFNEYLKKRKKTLSD